MYAVWTLDSDNYELIYHSGLGAPEETWTVSPLTENQKHQLLNEFDVGFSNPNHILIGWSTDLLAAQVDHLIGSIFIMPANNVDLYAVWGAATYTYSIEYYPNGADTPSGKPGTPAIEYFENGNGVSLKLPSELGFEKAGYVIAGWAGTENGQIGYDTTASVSPATPSLKLYAVWGVKTEGDHTVTYDAGGKTIESDGDQLPQSSKFDEDGHVDVPDGSGMIVESYKFAGWKSNKPVEVEGDLLTDTFIGDGTEFFYMPASDVTLTAQWTEDNGPYYVEYDGNGYTGFDIPEDLDDYVYKEKVIVKSSHGMDYEGYTFKNWNTKADGTGTSYKAGDTFRITEDTTLYAQWHKAESSGGGSGSGTGGATVVDPTPSPGPGPDPEPEPGPGPEPEPPAEPNKAMIYLIYLIAAAVFVFLYRREDEIDKDFAENTENAEEM
ncbi:hypothetical protein MmiAt1_14200 [Methanimicrococcus sp. At1]|uniref:Uncharacterized protein n=1 Tax=Methanimicrococcus hacksteinii TaxID=3028293 RepID=A0ABU3VQZ7_9EURY|nr:hypothetical protein [Methanimicrococcus sp. At1]